MGTICLLKHRSTWELPHICKLPSALRKTICGYLTRKSPVLQLGAMMVLAQESVLAWNGLRQMYLLLSCLVSPMKILSCVGGPGGLKFLESSGTSVISYPGSQL